MTKPSDEIKERASYALGGMGGGGDAAWFLCLINEILDYLDRPTLKKDCFRCHDLPEGVVVEGHDHRLTKSE